MKVHGRDSEYDGDVDEDGACCGIGTAMDKFNTNYEGTWLNNSLHGICKYFTQYS